MAIQTYKTRRKNKNQAPNNFNKCQAQKATNTTKTMRVKATTTTVETREAQDSEVPMTNLEENTVAEEGRETTKKAMEVGTTINAEKKGTTKMENAKDHFTKGPTVTTMVSKDSRSKETLTTTESSTSNQKSRRTQTTAGITAMTTIFS